MFVFEKMSQDYRDRVRQWEKSREIFKSKQEYYYPGYYEKNHPRPGYAIKKVASILFPLVVVSLVTLGIVILVFYLVPDNQEGVEVSNKDCQSFNKKDSVRIQYGSYKDTTGTITGGCEKGQQYQVKIDEDQWADMDNDSHTEKIDVSGKILSVNSSKNLVVIDDEEK